VLTLKQTRELVQASQQRLADAADLNVNVVADIEQGRNKRPAHEVVVKVVRGLRALGVTGITSDVIAEFHVPEAPEAQAVNS
jgi:predicted transcriptional regulator